MISSRALSAAKLPRVILIGSYKKDQLRAWRPWYCYPLTKADTMTEKDAAHINELWLFRGTSEQQRTIRWKSADRWLASMSQMRFGRNTLNV